MSLSLTNRVRASTRIRPPTHRTVPNSCCCWSGTNGVSSSAAAAAAVSHCYWPAAACVDATVLQLMQPRWSWRLPRLCEANRERECAELADTGRLRLNVRPFVARRMHNSLPFETNTHHQQQFARHKAFVVVVVAVVRRASSRGRLDNGRHMYSHTYVRFHG